MTGTAASRGPASKVALVTAVGELLDEDPTVLPGARAIARRAGVHHSLIFRHFPSVEALIGRVAEARLRDRFDALDPSSSTLERIGIVLSALCSIRAALGLIEITPSLAARLVGARAAIESPEAGIESERCEVVLWALVGHAAVGPKSPDEDATKAFVGSLARLLEVP